MKARHRTSTAGPAAGRLAGRKYRWLGAALLAVMAVAVVAESAPGDAWPMFRGDPALWGVAGCALPAAPSLLWTFKSEGPVKCTAAVGAGRAYIGSDDGKLYALDLATGKQVWELKTGGPVESSPLLLRGVVYAGSSDASLYAVDAATGRVRWKYTTGDRILGAPNWVPAPKGGVPWILVGSYDFKLHCVDAATGKSIKLLRGTK